MDWGTSKNYFRSFDTEFFKGLSEFCVNVLGTMTLVYDHNFPRAGFLDVLIIRSKRLRRNYCDTLFVFDIKNLVFSVLRRSLNFLDLYRLKVSTEKIDSTLNKISVFILRGPTINLSLPVV